MQQSHGAGHDMLLLSPPGEGKSTAVSYFCSLLGYAKRRVVHAHPDMTLHDLFLRRVTLSNGETSWEASPLLTCIQEGNVCVLDHVHKLRSGVLAGLQSLCLDRDVWLPDGRRIMAGSSTSSFLTTWKDDTGRNESNKDRAYPDDDESDGSAKIVRVHPSFRLIALGSSEGSLHWLTHNVQGMLSTIVLPSPTADCYRAILHQQTNTHHQECPTELVDRLLHVHATLTSSVAEDCGVMRLSTRNMIRVVKQLHATSTVSDLHRALGNVLVADLLPPLKKETLNSVLRQVGVVPTPGENPVPNARQTIDSEAIQVDEHTCRIGDFSMPRGVAQRPERVPSPKFFDIPSHVTMLKEMLQTWTAGERAFLLLGNQGVGKNVLVDRLCQIANFEREVRVFETARKGMPVLNLASWSI